MPAPATHPLLDGRKAIHHLLRRAAFGPTPEEAAALAGPDAPAYEDVVEQLLAGLDRPPAQAEASFDPFSPLAIQHAWLTRMLRTEAPLAERLALFWHHHFATSDKKVQDPSLLWRQYELFRTHGAGPFEELVRRVSRDVAMIRWLDGNANRKGHPNENYARELQELFVLGIGRYDEADVREVARAFTGWGSKGRAFHFESAHHDDGPKLVHGRRGAFDGDDVVALLTSLDACHTHVAGRLIAFFSHPDPEPEEILLVARAFAADGATIRDALRTLFLAPSFRRVSRARALVRSPVELLVAGLRAAEVETVPEFAHRALDRMGQILFRPPSVKGWPRGAAWLTSTSLVARIDLAWDVAGLSTARAVRDVEETAFDGDVPRPLRRMLRAARGRGRVQVALASPEYQLA